jgi:hypothetical protein
LIVISVEKIRKKSNKYGSFFKILDENTNQNFHDKLNYSQKSSLQTTENKFRNTKVNPSSNLLNNTLFINNEQKEFHSKILRSHVSLENFNNLDSYNFKNIGETNGYNEPFINNSSDSNNKLNNFFNSKLKNSKNCDKTDDYINTPKNYQRREDNKDEYKIIYQEEESEAFKRNDDIFNIDFNINSPNEEQKDNFNEKLGIIDEENSCEFELKDFLNKLNLNDDEEFPLDGKYFDNIYQDKLKTKKEKMDLIFQNIIKRQKKIKLEQNISSKRSSEIIDNDNFLKQGKIFKIISNSARENYDLHEIDKLKHFERKDRIRSLTSLDRISNKNFDIVCEVLEEGSVSINSCFSFKIKKINYRLDNVILSAKDIIDINKCISLGVNNLSFIINNVKNIEEIKEIISEEQLLNVKIFARLETQESLINFDSILNEVDGIILNHGFKFYNFQYKDVK